MHIRANAGVRNGRILLGTAKEVGTLICEGLGR
jgi:hypothetical protein